MIDLSPRQKQALARDKNIAVTASAGTGKTTLLVERYLDILLNEENTGVKNVVAITFTEKAAAEMSQRVSLRIGQLLKDPAHQNQRKKILQIRNQLNSAYISTIHAFCLRILKEFPVESGLDPDFGICNSLQRDKLIEEALLATMEMADNEPSAWISIFRYFGFSKIQNMLHSAVENRFNLNNTMPKILEKTSEELFGLFRTEFYKTINQEFTDSFLSEVAVAVRNLLEVEKDVDLAHDKAAEIFIKLKDFSSSDQKSEEYWNAFLELSFLVTKNSDKKAYGSLNSLGGRKTWTGESEKLLFQLSSIMEPVALWFNSIGGYLPEESDLRFFREIKLFYKLANYFLDAYHGRKNDSNLLDFEDLQIALLELIRSDNKVLRGLDEQFKYIMVDEFQDTNWLQWDIISRINGIKQNKVFIVGDPKQSIYGFRNADVRVFEEVKKQFSSKYADSIIDLQESYRFKYILNYNLNHIFRQLLHLSADNPWETGFLPTETVREDRDGGSMNLVLMTRENQVEFIAKKINEIISTEEYKPGQIAVLLRARTYLANLEEALRRNGVPFKTIGGTGFYQRQEIYDVYNLLRFLSNPDDDMALVGVLRSPFAGISDEGLFFLGMKRQSGSYWKLITDSDFDQNMPESDEANITRFRLLAEKWLDLRDRIELPRLLNMIFDESLYQATVSAYLNGRQLSANLGKIISIARQYEETEQLSLYDFSGMLEKLINSETREGDAGLLIEDLENIKVMTIHQAKGLQFPVTFVPFLEQSVTLQDSVFFDENWGIVAAPDGQGESNAITRFVRNSKLQREMAELKRIFYVAATRTKDHLFLCGGSDKSISENSILGQLLNKLDLDFKTEEQVIETGGKMGINIVREITGSAQTTEKATANIRKLIKNIESYLQKTPKPDEATRPVSIRELKDSPKGEIFSATQIMTFLKDPQSYQNKYILGFFEEDYEFSEGADSDDTGLLKGSVIHKYFEFYPHKTVNDLLFDFEIFDKDLFSLLTEEINQIIIKVEHSAKLQKILKNPKSENEVSVTMALNEHYLTGTLDKMYFDAESGWRVIDYKTNRVNRKNYQAVAKKYKAQIEVYALLLSGLYEQDLYGIDLYFTEIDTLYTTEFKKADIVSIREKISGIIMQILELYQIN